MHNTDENKLTTLVSGSGCTALVVPANYEGTSLGEQVLLAYDGGRASSRAIFDALPLLLRSNDVWLHSVDSPGDNTDTLQVDDDVRDLADALSQHGVDVEVSTSKAKARTTSGNLLSVATGHGANCMVMGVPAHSRLRDMLPGSAARHALHKSDIPVLFSAQGWRLF